MNDLSSLELQRLSDSRATQSSVYRSLWIMRIILLHPRDRCSIVSCTGNGRSIEPNAQEHSISWLKAYQEKILLTSHFGLHHISIGISRRRMPPAIVPIAIRSLGQHAITAAGDQVFLSRYHRDGGSGKEEPKDGQVRSARWDSCSIPLATSYATMAVCPHRGWAAVCSGSMVSHPSDPEPARSSRRWSRLARSLRGIRTAVTPGGVMLPPGAPATRAAACRRLGRHADSSNPAIRRDRNANADANADANTFQS